MTLGSEVRLAGVLVRYWRRLELRINHHLARVSLLLLVLIARISLVLLIHADIGFPFGLVGVVVVVRGRWLVRRRLLLWRAVVREWTRVRGIRRLSRVQMARMVFTVDGRPCWIVLRGSRCISGRQLPSKMDNFLLKLV